MTYNYFAYKRYNGKTREFIRKVREQGELIIDEVDMLSYDKFDGCQESYDRIYRKGEEWNGIIGLSATPDKIFHSLSIDSKLKIYEEFKEQPMTHVVFLIKLGLKKSTPKH